ncbi:hypothetical protein [Streptomyces sp. NPDC059122]|uniref:hypothetical protein n=1 Tax=Streptomyces sp. NPDC059122 TaxID=3346732 RepID=UPI003695A9EC
MLRYLRPLPRPGGLAIARNIAHTHGGSLTAHTSPQGGAGLLLRLPTPQYRNDSMHTSAHRSVRT